MVATSDPKKGGRDVIQWSRHQLQTIKDATSLSDRDISCKERLAVATSDPRNAKDKSRPNKSLWDEAETTKVATKNRGRDINN